MSKSKVRVRAVPQKAQAAVARAIATLSEKLGLDPEAIAVTRIDFLEPSSDRREPELPESLAPTLRIFLLAKGVQYVFRTQEQRLILEEERFVV